MRHAYLDIASTPAVRAAREHEDGIDRYAQGEGPLSNDRLGAAESAFIASRDSFYLASVSASGWPYVQHRGGPPGFLRVLDDTTLAFADYRGNKQYITLGNTHENPRVSLFLMGYARQRRLKLYGTLRVTDDAELLAKLPRTDARTVVERGMVISVSAFDWNCPQHITPRFTEAEIHRAAAPLHARIAELEAENATLRATSA